MLAQEENQHHQAMMMTMMKGKRTKRSRTASPLALTMSTSGDDSCLIATSSSTTTLNFESNSSPTPTTPTVTEEEEDMANCLILLAQGASKIQKLTHPQLQESPALILTASKTPVAAASGAYAYECKTCNRCFPSFQALGGHRASHRKPKLSAADAPAPALSLADDHRPHQDYFPSVVSSKINKAEDLGLSLQIACNSSNTLSASNNNPHNESNNVKLNKVHACAICGSEFSSGQALGGHMRRHRPIATSSGGSPAAKSASPPAPARNLLCLDLNLPADEQEDHQQQQQQQPAESAKFIFASSEKTLVFANSLVDCRY